MKTFLIGIITGFFLTNAGNVHAYAPTPQQINNLFVISEESQICEMVTTANEEGFSDIYPFILRMDDTLTLCWEKAGMEIRSIAVLHFSQIKFLLDDTRSESTVTFIFGGKSSLFLKWVQGSYEFFFPLFRVEIRTPRKYWEIFNQEP